MQEKTFWKIKANMIEYRSDIGRVYMANEQEFMSFEQIADLILGTRDLNKLGVIGGLAWALFYQYGKNPKSPRLEADFTAVQENLENALNHIEQPDLREKLNKIITLTQQIKRAAQKPYDEKSIEFMARLKTILQAYYAKAPASRYEISNIDPANAEQYMMLMLSRLNLIKDERVKYNILGFFYEYPGGTLEESARQAFVMRANNKYATSNDLYNLMIIQSNSGEDVRTTFQDLEAIARRNLVAELAKEAPDLGKLKEIINTVRFGANLTRDNAIISQVNQIYDLQKLLLPNAAEYISKAPDTYAQKMTDLEAQVAELKTKLEETRAQLAEKSAEVQKLGNELATTKQTLSDAQGRNQTLNQENSALRQENEGLSRSKTTSEDRLQQLITGARNIKSGIGSRGVDAYKKMVEEMDAGIIAMAEQGNQM